MNMNNTSPIRQHAQSDEIEPLIKFFELLMQIDQQTNKSARRKKKELDNAQA